MEIHEIIKKSRKEKGLTQQELADKIDRSLRMVQKYESGEVQPSIEVLNSIISDELPYTSVSISGGVKLNKILSITPNLIFNLLKSLALSGDINYYTLTDEDLQFLSDMIKNLLIQQAVFLTDKNTRSSISELNLIENE